VRSHRIRVLFVLSHTSKVPIQRGTEVLCLLGGLVGFLSDTIEQFLYFWNVTLVKDGPELGGNVYQRQHHSCELVHAIQKPPPVAPQGRAGDSLAIDRS
jgi:hypothetical protein